MQSKLSALVLASAVMAAAALTSIPAMASTIGATKLNVPFDFTVNGKTLPAGEYTVRRETLGNFIKLEGKDPSVSFVWVSEGADARESRVVLRFAVDGQMHALESIQDGAYVTPRLVHKARKTEDITPQYVPGQ